MSRSLLGSVALSLWLCAAGADALPIVLRDTGGAAPGTQAGDAFAQAAARVGSFFSDPTTLFIDVGFSNMLPTGVLGATDATLYTVSPLASVRAALIFDATTIWDGIAVSNLGSGPLEMFTNHEDGLEYFDDNDTLNNNGLVMTQANLRSLGLDFATASDGSITFSSLVNWDFDPSDGIGVGMYDFVGVATHEILHVMGFTSGVTDIDVYTGLGPRAGQASVDDGYWYRTMDLFRYRAPGVRDMAFGGSPYFSIDGGVTNLGSYSTGVYNGDGQQPSHWRDGQNLGLMDPTLAAGELGVLRVRDLVALDVIGWDLALAEAPELDGGAATLPLAFACLSLLVSSGRRRRS